MLTRMSLFIFIILSIASFNSFAISESDYQAKVTNIYDSFKAGDYESALKVLDVLDRQVSASRGDLKRKAFVYYFKGIVLAKMFEFNQSIENFKMAIKLKHDAKDLYYEYAQVLYTDEKLEPARLAFKESIKRGFKRGVSLYYIAYISELLGEERRAVKFFKAINRLPDEEKDEILQSAEAQIAEIYLKRVLKKRDAVRKIEAYVIPQFERALAIDENSEQGRRIRQRIFEIKKRYELILLKMRNGRPVYYPRHFLRFLQTIASDDNVAYQTDDAISSDPDSAKSLFSETNLFGRYSFTVKNYMFLAPELGLRYKKHFNDEDTVKAFDSYSYSAALRSSYEHKAFGKPASFLMDYSFNQENRFNTTEEGFKFYTQTHNFSIGQKLEYFDMGTTILRLGFANTIREDETNNSSTLSLSLEQVIRLSDFYSAFLFSSFNQTSSDTEAYASTSWVNRIDFILPPFWGDYRPFLGFVASFTKPESQAEERGTETSMGPSLRLSKRVGTNTRLNLRYDYLMNSSGLEDYEYKKNTIALDFEAVF